MPALLIDRIPDSYEVRAFADDLRSDAAIGSFNGHASIFGNVDSYATAMVKGAFRKTIADKEGRIPVLYFHEPKEMIGPANVLREDKQGLYHESQAIDDNRTGSYVLAHMRGGTPMGMSFGFSRRKDRVATDDDQIDMSTAPEGVKQTDVRLITEVELFEISVLPWVYAANPKAGIDSVRSNIHAQSLSFLIEHIRGGSLHDDDAALVADLVAAWSERAEPEPPDGTPLPEEQARRRNRDVEIALEYGRLLTGVQA